LEDIYFEKTLKITSSFDMSFTRVPGKKNLTLLKYIDTQYKDKVKLTKLYQFKAGLQNFGQNID